MRGKVLFKRFATHTAYLKLNEEPKPIRQLKFQLKHERKLHIAGVCVTESGGIM